MYYYHYRKNNKSALLKTASDQSTLAAPAAEKQQQIRVTLYCKWPIKTRSSICSIQPRKENGTELLDTNNENHPIESQLPLCSICCVPDATPPIHASRTRHECVPFRHAPVTHPARFPGHHWCSLDWVSIAVGWGTVRLACPRSHRRSRDHRMLCCGLRQWSRSLSPAG
jgi:hypothetical protein